MIKQWAEDYGRLLDEVAVKFGLDADSAAERKARLIAQKIAAIEKILNDGLDIGGIIKHIVPVTLGKNPQHGWVFVKENGEMFNVYSHIKKRRNGNGYTKLADLRRY